jgi:hypothetical protein
MSDSVEDDYITAGPSGPASSVAPLVSHARTSEEALPTSSRLASAMSDSVEDDYITAGPSGPPASSVAPRAPPLLSGGTSKKALPPSSRVAGGLPPPVVTEDGSGDYIEVDNVLAGHAPSVAAAAGAVSSDYVAPKDIRPAQETTANPQADNAHPHTVDGPKNAHSWLQVPRVSARARRVAVGKRWRSRSCRLVVSTSLWVVWILLRLFRAWATSARAQGASVFHSKDRPVGRNAHAHS